MKKSKTSKGLCGVRSRSCFCYISCDDGQRILTEVVGEFDIDNSKYYVTKHREHKRFYRVTDSITGAVITYKDHLTVEGAVEEAVLLLRGVTSNKNVDLLRKYYIGKWGVIPRTLYYPMVQFNGL